MTKSEIDEYFDSVRGEETESTHGGNVRWGGKGKVKIIYYLPDHRVLSHVTFKWKEVSRRGKLTAPVAFTGQNVPLPLLPQLARAQSHRQQVFVDFWTDKDGGNPKVLAVATFSR